MIRAQTIPLFVAKRFFPVKRPSYKVVKRPDVFPCVVQLLPLCEINLIIRWARYGYFSHASSETETAGQMSHKPDENDTIILVEQRTNIS